MEVQTTVLDIIADLKHPLNTSEQNTEVHVSKTYRHEDCSREAQRERNWQAGKKKDNVCGRSSRDRDRK